MFSLLGIVLPDEVDAYSFTEFSGAVLFIVAECMTQTSCLGRSSY